MSRELALSLIKLLSALEAAGIINGKLPDYLLDHIQNSIESLSKIVLEDKQ